MNMTDEQRYSAVLKELGEVLQNKNTTISCLQWQIDELKARLEATEEERDTTKEKLDSARAAIDNLQDEIAQLKGGGGVTVNEGEAREDDENYYFG